MLADSHVPHHPADLRRTTASRGAAVRTRERATATWLAPWTPRGPPRRSSPGASGGSVPIELLDHPGWTTLVELASALADWRECCHLAGLHRRLSHLSPEDSDRRHCAQAPDRLRPTIVHYRGLRSTGGGDGIRTHCLYIANVALYQLSYTPAKGQFTRSRSGSRGQTSPQPPQPERWASESTHPRR